MPTRCTRFQPRSEETAHASVPQGGLCFNDQGGLSPLAATGELADTGPGPPSGASKDSVERGLSSLMRRPPSKSAPWKRQQQPARLAPLPQARVSGAPFPQPGDLLTRSVTAVTPLGAASDPSPNSPARRVDWAGLRFYRFFCVRTENRLCHFPGILMTSGGETRAFCTCGVSSLVPSIHAFLMKDM